MIQPGHKEQQQHQIIIKISGNGGLHLGHRVEVCRHGEPHVLIDKRTCKVDDVGTDICHKPENQSDNGLFDDDHRKSHDVLIGQHFMGQNIVQHEGNEKRQPDLDPARHSLHAEQRCGKKETCRSHQDH